MTIRGVEREVAMPVRMVLDDAHRLSVEGELDLKLSDYGVPVPSKLGVVKMKDQVRVWIALRARLDPRSQG
jgi:polyisoprenoid-binding protein YceI